MEALELQRKAIQQLVARALGTDSRMPRYLTGHAKSANELSTHMALPQKIVAPIQDLTDGSFFFMAGYDGLGQVPLGG